MLISTALNAAFNQQVAHELLSSNLYINIAGYFDNRALRLLAELFYKQADEERGHALKFVKYIADTDGKVEIPAVAAPKADYANAEEAVETALAAELDITSRINALMTQAIQEQDYAAQDFLRWFVTEQIEEVKRMDDMLKIVQASGERNVIMVEAYLAHNE